jgi:(4S)-4-hydroxy-5-phosphonooxypentane-2,3-dione isomerase
VSGSGSAGCRKGSKTLAAAPLMARARTSSNHHRKEDDMLIQSIHFTFAAEDADKVETILRELRDASRKEEGVITFDVARSQEKPNVFALWEAYKDKAALDSHIATEHFERLVVNGVRKLAQQRNAETVFPI